KLDSIEGDYKYLLIHGRHRHAAALIKEKPLPINVLDPMSDLEVVQRNVIMNTARGLSFVEQAEYVAEFRRAWEETNLSLPSHQETCEYVGFSYGLVSRIHNHLKAPACVQQALKDHDISYVEAAQIATSVKKDEDPAERAAALVDEAKESRGGE